MDSCLRHISKHPLACILSPAFLRDIRLETTRHLLRNLTRFVNTSDLNAKAEQEVVGFHISGAGMITSVSQVSSWEKYQFSTTILKLQRPADRNEDYD